MHALSLVLRTYTSPIHGVVGWSCNIHSMVLPTKISSHCACPLACFKDIYLSHPWGVGWSCNVHSLMRHASPIKILQDLAVQALWLVLSSSLVLWGGGEVAIFTPWCFMVLPTKISSRCAGPLACFKSFFWNIELVNQ